MKNILIFESTEDPILSRNKFYALKKDIPNQNFLLAMNDRGLERTLSINSRELDGIIYSNVHGDLAKEYNNEFHQNGINKVKEISQKYSLPILVIQSLLKNNEEEYKLLKEQGIIKNYATPFGFQGHFNPQIKQFIDSL